MYLAEAMNGFLPQPQSTKVLHTVRQPASDLLANPVCGRLGVEPHRFVVHIAYPVIQRHPTQQRIRVPRPTQLRLDGIRLVVAGGMHQRLGK